MMRGRTKKSLARKREIRLRQDPVLIVCEGKTEISYIKAFMESCNINFGRIHFGDVGRGSSPRNLYNLARRRYMDERRRLGDYRKPPYRKVFCVFDENGHPSYGETLRLIENANPAGIFKAITSVPCFEYWLVLHFEDNVGPYAGEGACRRLIREKLHKHIRNYKKEINDAIAKKLMSNLSAALGNSEKSLRSARNHDSDNPTTLMHELIKELQRMAP